VSIVRRAGRVKFPSCFQLVAAANPCPCGVGEESKGCECLPGALERYRSRMSGPVLDRIDLSVFVSRPAVSEFGGTEPTSSTPATTEEAAGRVAFAREAQLARLGEGRLNRDASAEELTASGALDSAAGLVLADAYERHRLSPRGRVRVLRVARTIADLSGDEIISEESVLAALGLRLRGATR
jgi:magnesium chelatase family protein